MKNTVLLIIKILLTVMISMSVPIVSLTLLLLLGMAGYWEVTTFASMLILPAIIPLIWLKKRKKYLIAFCSYLLVFSLLVGTQIGINEYDEKITVDVSPSIKVNEYLPFDPNSKIVKVDSQTLKLYTNLPILDGAAAVFPVYSAFVNAVYPNTVKLDEKGPFVYNNTVEGYKLLAERKTDIFFGAYPSAEQREYAEKNKTLFVYTPIGSEAFVFFVHKDNPIESLTAEQLRGIYSGEITNWSEVGGKNEKIVAYQRNEGSGSQSMLERFMGDVPIMKAPKEEVVSGMGGIIEQVADYRSKTSSIGFSFRFYVEGIIKNPDIKMIAVDGVAPTVENIKNGAYSIVTPLYAVSYEGNDNKNVDKLLEWILSDEGQYIIEETGYVGIGK